MELLELIKKLINLPLDSKVIIEEGKLLVVRKSDGWVYIFE